MDPLPEVAVDANAAEASAYRAYALDRTGRLSVFIEVEAGDHGEAVRLTRVLAEFYTIELWRGAQVVGRFGPENEGGAVRGVRSSSPA